MNDFKKFGAVEKSAGAAGAEQLAKINALTLRELGADEVFVFRVAACDDQVDRDFERFPVESLRKLGEKFRGKTIIMDHEWSSKNQTARIFDAAVETKGGVSRLVLSAYMLKNESTADAIASIEGGILKEVSVACAMGRAVCGICGTDKVKNWCEHRPGSKYDGTTCVVDLLDVADAYEVSFVAVPAQPGAGVVKAYGGEGSRPGTETVPDAELERRKALALLELEEKAL